MIKNRTILVADDNAAIREMLAQGLTMMGYRVLTASDGEEAYRAWTTGSVDGIICDIMMPGMDGISLCKLLRDKGFVGPIILLTVLDQIKKMGEGLVMAGADRYIVKPCDVDTLRDHLEELFAREAV